MTHAARAGSPPPCRALRHLPPHWGDGRPEAVNTGGGRGCPPETREVTDHEARDRDQQELRNARR